MPTWRLVQRGNDPVCIVYLMGPGLDNRLREALPLATIVATAESIPDVGGALRCAGASSGTPYVLVGYSAGCSAVRHALYNGAHPVGVVTADGTHAMLPPAEIQVDVWRQLALEARRRERVWAASCLGRHDYVERLPQGQRYACTATVLAAALDWRELAEHKALAHPLVEYPGPIVLERHEGGLHVEVYDSTQCDHDAHLAQGRNVLPDLLRQYIAPLYAVQTPSEPPDTEPAPVAPGSLESAALARAVATVGIREVGSNRGPWIDEAIRACGLLPPQYWCACAVSRWVHEGAADIGVAPPFPRTAGALNLSVLLTRAGLFHTAAELRANPTLIVPGMIPVWLRPDGGPGAGHAGIVEDGLDRNIRFGTIEGNEGDQVHRMRRALHDPLLVGMGRLSRGDIDPAPTPEALAIAAQQLALSLALRDGVSGLDSLPSAEPNS